MECQNWAITKSSKRECLEVVGIPREVEQKDLEGKMLSVLEKVGCKIDRDNIGDCHWLSKKSDNVIINNLNLEYLGFHEESKNRILCQYYDYLKP